MHVEWWYSVWKLLPIKDGKVNENDHDDYGICFQTSVGS